jgi:outer membrane receptor for ferric coprogen and ferric-rhodotorulic acid
LQYRYVDVGYDTAVEKDNTQHYGYGGVEWDTTEKLSLAFKAGYQKREFEADEVAGNYNWDGFTFSLRSLYRFTEKTQFSFNAYSRSEESDSSFAADKQVLGLFASYQQRFTDRFSGVVDFIYERSDYSQIIDEDRDDDRFYLKPALRYQFRDWLMTELAYSFETRDSTVDILDYDTNTVILNLTFAL